MKLEWRNQPSGKRAFIVWGKGHYCAVEFDASLPRERLARAIRSARESVSAETDAWGRRAKRRVEAERLLGHEQARKLCPELLL